MGRGKEIQLRICCFCIPFSWLNFGKVRSISNKVSKKEVYVFFSLIFSRTRDHCAKYTCLWFLSVISLVAHHFSSEAPPTLPHQSPFHSLRFSFVLLRLHVSHVSSPFRYYLCFHLFVSDNSLCLLTRWWLCFLLMLAFVLVQVMLAVSVLVLCHFKRISRLNFIILIALMYHNFVTTTCNIDICGLSEWILYTSREQKGLTWRLLCPL